MSTLIFKTQLIFSSNNTKSRVSGGGMLHSETALSADFWGMHPGVSIFQTLHWGCCKHPRTTDRFSNLGELQSFQLGNRQPYLWPPSGRWHEVGATLPSIWARQVSSSRGETCRLAAVAFLDVSSLLLGRSSARAWCLPCVWACSAETSLALKDMVACH